MTIEMSGNHYETSETDTDRRHVLIVDDEVDFVDSLADILESRDFIVDVAHSEKGAMEKIATVPADVVLLDVRLGHSDGVQLIAQLKKTRPNIVCVMMTGYAEIESTIHALHEGAYDYLHKPLDAHTLLATLGRCFEKLTLEKNQRVVSDALRASEELHRAMIDNMVDGVIRLDEDGTIFSFNHAAEVIFSYTCAEAMGKNINILLELVPGGSNSFLGAHISNENSALVCHQMNALRKSGEVFPLLFSLSLLPFKGVDRKQWIFSCLDISIQKRQEELLRRSQKMDALGKFTGGIAHDFNNVLSIILGNSEQIRDHLREPEKVEKYAEQIRLAAERGSKLTSKLLKFARQRQPEVSVVDVNVLLRDQLNLLEKILTSRVNVLFQLADNVWPVELDKQDFEDAIVNLCLNAMHAMQSVGQIAISSCNREIDISAGQRIDVSAGSYVSLSVADTGSGIAAEILEKIFDPFYTTKGELGTGLGLSQVYGFVKRSGGAIEVHSELNRGSCFTLHFPKSRKAFSSEESVPIKSNAVLSGHETLLVVDDEQALVDLAAEMLSFEGYRVLTANDGLQALAVLEKEQVSLIVSDVVMPNMDGYQFAEVVRQRYPHIRVQMVSGFTDDRGHKVDSNELTAHILHKPYTMKTLLKRVRYLLDLGKIQIPNAKRTVLVLDDDEDAQMLYKIKLEKLDCLVSVASNGDMAIEHYRKALDAEIPIDLLIVDLSIPGGIGGKEVASAVRKINPYAKIIVASGNVEAPEMIKPLSYGFDGAVRKDISQLELKSMLDNIFAHG